MPSKSYWRKKQERQRERGRKGAEARWARHHADAGPVRISRHIEIEVRASDRTTEIIRLRQDQMDNGRWSRYHIIGHHGRPLAARGIATLIAQLIG